MTSGTKSKRKSGLRHHRWSIFKLRKIFLSFATVRLSCASIFRAVSWILCAVLVATGKDSTSARVCSTHLITGRICINLNLDGQRVGFWTLSGIFEVAHMDEEITEADLQYPKGSVKHLLSSSIELIR